MTPDALRDSLANALHAVGTRAAVAFARAIVDDGDLGGPPCWGQIDDLFREVVTCDDARVEVLPAFMAVGSTAVLLLFFEASRDRPRVVHALAQNAGRLPVGVQCALAATPEGALALRGVAGVDPSAVAILDGDEGLRARERAIYTAFANSLRAHRTRAPRSSSSTKEVFEAQQAIGALP